MLDLQPDLAFTRDQADRLLEAWLGGPVECSGIRRLKGGLVNTVVLLEFDRPPHRAVVKLHEGTGDVFGAEARALEHLRSETECPVPAVYLEDATGDVIPYALLLLEHVPGRCLDGLRLEPADHADIETQLADVLGELHRHRGDRWGRLDGVDGPGGIGGPDAWADLFTARLREIRAQPTLSERLDAQVLTGVDGAIEKAPVMLGESPTPTLVHGDVWAGNVMVERHGSRWKLAALLDPDLQYADVEYELAYQEVFGTRRDVFFAAYRRHHQLRPGYEHRRLVYWLYTALVHVALFGDRFFRTFTASTANAINGLPGV